MYKPNYHPVLFLLAQTFYSLGPDDVHFGEIPIWINFRVSIGLGYTTMTAIRKSTHKMFRETRTSLCLNVIFDAKQYFSSTVA